MKRVLLALSALSVIVAAGSAAAQPNIVGWGDAPYGGPRGPMVGYDFRPAAGRGEMLAFRVQRMAERGDLSWREARALRAQLDGVRRLEWRYGRDGLSRWENADLDRRYDSIRQRIRWERADDERFDGDRPWSGRGW